LGHAKAAIDLEAVYSGDGDRQVTWSNMLICKRQNKGKEQQNLSPTRKLRKASSIPRVRGNAEYRLRHFDSNAQGQNVEKQGKYTDWFLPFQERDD
jgi:hypothetical protein